MVNHAFTDVFSYNLSAPNFCYNHMSTISWTWHFIFQFDEFHEWDETLSGNLLYGSASSAIISPEERIDEKKSGEKLGGNGGENIEKMKKKASGYSYIEHVYQIS